MQNHRALLATTFLLVACSGDEGSPAEPPIPEGVTRLATLPREIAAGEEVSSLCYSWTLENEETLWLSSAALTTEGGVHHSNWFWVPERYYRGDDGAWPCTDRAFDNAVAGGQGGVIFAQSTQVTAEDQTFPEGVALAIGPRARIVANLHFLNATGAAQDGRLTLDLRTIPAAEVTIPLVGMGMENRSIVIPPRTRSELSMTCPIGDRHREHLGRDPDFRIHYLLPHYHELGTGARLEVIGTDGTVTPIFSTTSDVGEPLGGTLSPAFDMTGAEMLRFTCSYDNPRTEPVRWGIGDQEMCVLLGFTDSPTRWGGTVLHEVTPAGESDGVMRFDADCTLVSFGGGE